MKAKKGSKNVEDKNIIGHPERWAFDLKKTQKPEEPLREKQRQKKLLTQIDNLVEVVRKRKSESLKKLAAELGWSVASVEKVGKKLERKGVVDVRYPATMVQEPKIAFIKELLKEPEKKVEGKIILQYSFEVDHVPANVSIIESKEDRRPFYYISTPYLGAYTEAFLDELRDSIAEKIPVEIAEITDVKKSVELKKKFFDVAKAELSNYLKESSEESINTLAGFLMHSMYGLGNLELIMADNWLEEVAINSAKMPVAVYHRKYGWMKTNVKLKTEEDIANYSSQIGRKVGREITSLNPILDAHLISGDRVNATLFPISSFGNTITIRRFARRPWTIVDFISTSNTFSIEMAALLWLAINYEMSIIVAGGTASGKTSMLNALSAFVPPYHRIISIEDVREIMLPEYLNWNWVPLTTRNPNPEGTGGVSMLQLLQSSLRMRPDRIILGEIRRKREAEALFEAMHTGHSVYSTLHANSGKQVLRRLIEPPIELPPLEVEALDLILVQYRDRRSNIRRTYEICEIESGVREEQLDVTTIYRWSPRTDNWDKVNEPNKLIQQLNLHTGMTQGEIAQDIISRAEILNWMAENKINEINKVGQVMKLYYSDDELVKNAAAKGLKPEKILD